MCGRFVQALPPSTLMQIFNCQGPTPNAAAQYNLPPTAEALVVRRNPEDGAIYLTRLTWGLVPRQSRTPEMGPKLTNARAETVAQKPSFADSFERRRCLVPVDAFYEWQRTGGQKQPFAFAPQLGRGPLALAGLWDGWRAPDGRILRTFSIITTGANAVMASIHDRMPVIIPEEAWARWLGPATGSAVADLLVPPEADVLRAWPVSARVNSGRVNEESLLDPLEIGVDALGSCAPRTEAGLK